ncbi:cytochrome P450 77A4-like [Miscanthus floridulus]|uniref:cytochrome P450 77A4-like n=1 Tax=Miscanthus floridulus TaxID=154761 RepID=UPI00345879B6
MLDRPPRRGLAFIVASVSMHQPTSAAATQLHAAMEASLMSLSFLQLTFTAVAAIAALAVAVAVTRYNRRYMGLRLPPGPPVWPIVGNLFQVAFSGKLFIHYIRDLRKEYGPILTLRMGERTLVIISSAELAHEALVEKGREFASRPRENTTRNIFSSNKFTVNSAVYGAEWRSLRRNMVSGMLSTSRLREFAHARRRAMDRFVSRMRAEAAASPDGASVWVLRNARFAVFCILLDMTFGLLDLHEEHILHIDAVMKRVLLAVGVRMDDYLPFLRPFFWRHQRRALAVRREQIDTLLPLISRRRAILRDMKSSSPPDPNVAAPFSYLDSVLDLHIEGRDGAPTDDELVTLCAELINGGTDTTATAIEWGMARIVDNPSIQARLHEEIMQQVGDARPVDDKDTDAMPYLQAFVKELLRKHPPTYFSLTHAAVQPGSKLAGYDVPVHANLDIFLPTISEDPKLWDRPTEFDPDRFVSGGETADMTGSGGIRMIPFGAGRRICPGLAMGTTHIALMVARMVQAFEWRAHPSQPPLDFMDKVEFTVVMDRPLLAAVKPRNLSF